MFGSTATTVFIALSSCSTAAIAATTFQTNASLQRHRTKPPPLVTVWRPLTMAQHPLCKESFQIIIPAKIELWAIGGQSQAVACCSAFWIILEVCVWVTYVQTPTDCLESVPGHNPPYKRNVPDIIHFPVISDPGAIHDDHKHQNTTKSQQFCKP